MSDGPSSLVGGSGDALAPRHRDSEHVSSGHAQRSDDKHATRLQFIAEQIGLIVWEYDRASKRFTFVDPQAERILGYSIDQWTQPGFWLRTLHPDDRERAVAFSHDQVDRGDDHEFEYRMVGPDGRVVWFRDITTVSAGSGAHKSLRGVLIDITARRRLEHAMMTVTRAVARVVGQTFFEQLVKSLSSALGLMFVHVALKNEDGTITTLAASRRGELIDNETCAVEGSPCEEVLKDGRTLAHADRVQATYPDCAPLKELSAASYLGVPIRDAAGQTIGLLVATDQRPLRDLESVLPLLNIFADRVTVELDRLRTEQHLRQSEQRMQTVAENIPGVVYSYDRQPSDHRELVYLGPGLDGIIGADAMNEAKRDFNRLFDRIHPGDQPALQAAVDRGLASGSIITAELRLRTDAGRYVWVRSASRPVAGDNGVVRWNVLLIDIDKEKREQLILQSLAERTSGVVGERFFASVVESIANSLDIRTTLIAERRMDGETSWPTLAFWTNGRLADNIELPINDELVQRLAAGKTVFVCDGAAEQFADDALVQSAGARGLFGKPLFDSAGDVIGLLLLMHNEPIEPRIEKLPALSNVASRASAELLRLQAERASHRSESNVRVIIEQMPAMLWTTDAQLVLRSSVGKGLADLELRPGETNGMSVYELHLQDDHGQKAIRMHERALRGESVNYENSYRNRHYQCHIEPLRDARHRVIGTIGVALDITEQTRAHRRLELMMRELDHRVRNNLASLITIAEQSAATTDSVPVFLESLTGRIASMARAYDVITRSRTKSVQMQAIVGPMLGPFASSNDERVHVAGEAIALPPAVAFPLCMILYELATNAAKHGALRSPTGRLQIDWRRLPDGRLSIDWRERCNTRVQPPETTGFGTSVIDGLIGHQLRGTVDRHYSPDGLQVSMRLTIPGDTAPEA